MASKERPLHDNVAGRGQERATPVGTTIFVGLRALDPLIQRSILLAAPLAPLLLRLGFSAPATPPTGGSIIQSLGLTPFQLVVVLMSAGSALKQIFWVLGTSKEPMDIPSAIAISVFNTINNALDTLAFTAAGSNTLYFSPYSMYVGTILFTIGILTEAIAETQRKRFKDRPENAGKAYSGGLFGLARNINYGGYIVWRSGFALSCGGLPLAALVFTFFFRDFSTRGIPVLDRYCENKYGEQWRNVKKDVPYKLFPGIY
jgi:protein-S-isoprenylcysteine O-methyltransferase Ste14